MAAVGRNPEASKFLGQALVFIAIIELSHYSPSLQSLLLSNNF